MNKGEFPKKNRGTDGVQRKWNDDGASPSVGGGGKSDMAKKTKAASSIPGSGK
jgi:hypothetical protein